MRGNETSLTIERGESRDLSTRHDMKRGFTLVELLVVITILGLLGLVIGYSVTEAIFGVRNDTSETLKKNIIAASKNWAAENIYLLPDVGDSIVLTLHDLMIGGYMEGDDDNQIKDTKNSEYISKLKTLITIKNNNGDYEYSLELKYGKDNVNLKAPAIILLGEKKMTITGTFTDPGVYAYNYDGEELGSVTKKIVDQNGVTVSSITTSGIYTITYTVTDSNGTSSISRTVVRN